VFRSTINVLRAASKRLTTPEIIMAMPAAKGITDAREKGIRNTAGAVQSSLCNHKGGSVTKRLPIPEEVGSLS
jgi:hypothetical protein